MQRAHHEIDKYKLFLGIKIKAVSENERAHIISVAYFVLRQSMQRYCKLKPYCILTVVIHVHIHSSWNAEAERFFCQPVLHSKTLSSNPKSRTKWKQNPNNILLANFLVKSCRTFNQSDIVSWKNISMLQTAHHAKNTGPGHCN